MILVRVTFDNPEMQAVYWTDMFTIPRFLEDFKMRTGKDTGYNKLASLNCPPSRYHQRTSRF